jgi:hypothetical protein
VKFVVSFATRTAITDDDENKVLLLISSLDLKYGVHLTRLQLN